MRAATLTLILLFSTGSLAAEEPETHVPELQDRLGETLRGLTDKMKPVWEDLKNSLGFIGEIDSLEYYETPEVLPNGDIILKRRPDAPIYQPPADQSPSDQPVVAPDAVPI